MDFVDEHDGSIIFLDLLHDRLEPFLEVAAIARTGQQHAHVELEDGAVLEHFRYFAIDDLAGQTLGDCRLAHARIAHEQRIVLRPAAQHLDGAVHFRLAPDQRVDLAVHGLLVEVDAEAVQRIAGLLVLGAFVLSGIVVRMLGTLHRPVLRQARLLRDAVRDEVDRIVAGHVLLLQEVCCMALALGKDRHEHVGPGHFFPARRLHVNHRALDHPLEAGRRLGVFSARHDQACEVMIDVIFEVGAKLLQVHAASAHHRRRITVIHQRQQQMLQRGIFVTAVAGQRQRPVQGLFEAS